MRVALTFALRGIVSFVTVILASTSTASAYFSQVPVELTVPATTITLQGIASPNSIVFIQKSESNIASVNTDSSGSFNSTFAVNAGINNLTVYYEDSAGLGSKKKAISVSAQTQQNISREVFLSPTIQRTSQGEIIEGSVVQLRGSTVPSARVTLDINYGAQNYTTKSDNQGRYEFLINSEDLGLGEKRVVVRSSKGGDNSDASRELFFTVVGDDVPSAPDDIVVSPNNLPPPVVLVPENNAQIDGNTIVISGESLSNAQINIYQDNQIIGSVFADDLGRWEFPFQAQSTPVILSFEACFDGRCSVFSQSVTFNFDLSTTSVCKDTFSLEQYRFWGVKAGDEIQLVLEQQLDGVVLIEWGDGVNERFTIDKNSNATFQKSYSEKGNYNGTLTLEHNDCSKDLYFSVSVVQGPSNLRFLWLSTLLLLIILGYQISRRDTLIKKDSP